MNALGRHILAEYYNCDARVLDDIRLVEESMKEAAVRAGSTIVDSVFRRFAPHGISGVVVIAESHLAIHTWPEYGYAAVDLFTCGEKVDPWVAYQYLREIFRAGDAECKELPRGELRVLGEGACHKPQGSLGPVPQQV
ncbi:MAG: S-adenosylmethionine decarboxylase proenzyme [bacterium]|nr:MAG: S-adenosylmethionine decarboxylase proenzyme [bacterium]